MSNPSFSAKLRAALQSVAPPASAAAAASIVDPAYVRDLMQRGEAVKLKPGQTDLPPGATHEIVIDAQGRTTLVHRRFAKA